MLLAFASNERYHTSIVFYEKYRLIYIYICILRYDMCHRNDIIWYNILYHMIQICIMRQYHNKWYNTYETIQYHMVQYFIIYNMKFPHDLIQYWYIIYHKIQYCPVLYEWHHIIYNDKLYHTILYEIEYCCDTIFYHIL